MSGELLLETVTDGPAWLDLDPFDCALPLRARNRLRVAGIRTIRALTAETPDRLLQLPYFGQQSLTDVESFLANLGLTLSTTVLPVLPAEVPTSLVAPAAPAPRSAPAGVGMPIDGARFVVDLLDEATAQSLDATLDVVAASLPDVAASMRDALGTSVADAALGWRLDRAGIARYANGLARIATRIAESRPVSFLDEVRLAIGGDTARDAAMAVRYFGLDGRPAKTLEAIGQSWGVTRERVRQRCKRFSDRVAARRLPMPLADETLRRLPGDVGTLGDWYANIPSSIRPTDAHALYVLRTLQEWEWLAPSTWVQHGGIRLVSREPGRDQALSVLAKRVARVLGRFHHIGAIDIERAAALAEVEPAFLSASLAETGRWRAVSAGWSTPRASARTVLGRRVREIVTVAGGTIAFEDLLRAVRRALRRPPPKDKPHVLPTIPARVLRSVCRAAGLQADTTRGTVSHDGIGTTGSAPTLSGTDAAIVALFASQSVCTVHELDEAVLAHGLSASSARVAISYSPLLKRLAYGVYTLVGRTPAVEDVVAASARLAKRMRDAFDTIDVSPDGRRIRLVYRAEAVSPLRSLALPTGVVPQGTWTMTGADGQRRDVRARPAYLTGLAGARRMAQEYGARLELLFDHDSRTAIWKLLPRPEDEYRLRHDPIEDTDAYKAIEAEVEALVRSEVDPTSAMGMCHVYWRVKQRILRERFGIDWRSPSECNPRVIFD